MQVCNVSGCPKLTASGKCPSCKAEARKASDSRRPHPAQRGYDRQHREDRELFLSMFPTCQEPGCDERATDLDHVDGNTANRDWGNYRGYCHSHHSKHTATMQPGGWNA